MSHLHPDDDIYPVRIYVDKRLWPVIWRFKGRLGRSNNGPREAMAAAMEHAKTILVPGTEVLLQSDGSSMFAVMPADPSYVPAD